jgi:hypothetical protein
MVGRRAELKKRIKIWIVSSGTGPIIPPVVYLVLDSKELQ